MAYIPPHKRHAAKGSESPKPTPTPEFLIRKNVYFKKERYLHTVYAENAVSKWFSVGLAVADDSSFSSLVRLEPVSVDHASLVLMHGRGEGYELLDTPWLFVAANVKQDLLLSFQHMKCEIKQANMAQVKPCLVARFGKVLFNANSSICQISLKNNPLTETTLRQMKKILDTNITPSYMEYMETRVVLKLGLEYVGEKELYHVSVSDKLRPDATVVCKCKISEDCKKIQLHKIEFNRVRHMVSDVSCLGKNTDLRLMLYKKIQMALSDEEMNGIKDIIGSAILDSEVQGGLRWPFGKDSSGGRYAVIRIHHTTAKSYSNSSLRLKLRHADRFDFRLSTGEVARESFLKMPGIISHLLEQTIEEDVVFKMLEDNLKLIWDHCLLDGSSS